ncbi:dNTP triphosphohydrolase [Blautia sp. JLR.GB0024]|uniref:deoxyguanosinetriphosphate triphosphohydrolase family protein n=1 Tax=Blautia sp. JLR.GB0024 TaxID=3123295 RepID=UPI0030043F54
MGEKQKLSEISEEIDRKFKSKLNMDFMDSRFYEEKNRDRRDGQFQRDYSRIMYASSFRRLQGKMQLLGIKPDQFFRNRLTHSLEVAQIARSIACISRYTSSETYVVEAGALAHDIGNPPFGHSGERRLNELFENIGGFEGNAQTLRILKSVERKRAEFPGLNLTYRTLLSVVKYFNKHKDDNGNIYKKFIYDDDYDFLKDFITKHDLKVRTYDVQIVDLSDEIAYAAHDLEDGLRQKCFTMDEILHEYYSKYGKSYSFKTLEKIVGECQTNSGYGKKNLDSSEYSKLFRQELSSSIINTLINDLGICLVTEEYKDKTGTMNEKEIGFMNFQEMAEGLKEITFKCINHNDTVYTYEKKGDIIIENLVEIYRADKKLLPPEYRAENILEQYGMEVDEDLLQERLICDFVSGMMDSYAINLYEKLVGVPFDKIIIPGKKEEKKKEKID